MGSAFPFWQRLYMPGAVPLVSRPPALALPQPPPALDAPNSPLNVAVATAVVLGLTGDAVYMMSEAPSQVPARPPLLRGNTVPLYVRTVSSPSSSSGQEQQWQPLEGFNGPHTAHPDKYSTMGQRTYPQNTPRAAQPMSLSQSNHGASSSGRPIWPVNMMPETPPLSNSPGSADSYLEEAYFPPVRSAPHPPSTRHQKVQGHPPPLPLSNLSQSVASPTIVSPTSYQPLRSSRGSSTPQSAKMNIESSPAAYSLSAAIGPGFDSDRITISALKGNILHIVADRWDCENDCHHEWKVQFDRDADMSGVRAGYTNGVLTVTVGRVNFARMPLAVPQMRR